MKVETNQRKELLIAKAGFYLPSLRNPLSNNHSITATTGEKIQKVS
jgi:hypothetical protein